MIPLRTNLPFVGRQTLLRRLAAIYRAGKHGLLVGPPGVGKTMLLAKLAENHPVLYAPDSGCLGDLLDCLEPQAGLDRGELKLAPRVHRLIAELPRLDRPLVLDNVRRVPPRVAHLIRVLLSRQSVWILARSIQPPDIGHVWPYLFFFTRVDVPPFSPVETRAFLTTVDYAGDREELLAHAGRLHRLSAGHPATLSSLLAEQRRHSYDLGSAEGLRLLALHARITRVETQLGAVEFA